MNFKRLFFSRRLLPLTRHFLFGPHFVCPVCKYEGPFLTLRATSGPRINALCPNCGSVERHRLQYLVLERIRDTLEFKTRAVLHFAPEPFFRGYFKAHCRSYESADIAMTNVDHRADMTGLPFADGRYDIVFASHVLEHIQDDAAAISEVARVLGPNGVAILPVPIGGEQTIEYSEPKPEEDFHVRLPGLDYFERYRHRFSEVTVYTSRDFDPKFQTMIHGVKGPVVDYVPVCRK